MGWDEEFFYSLGEGIYRVTAPNDPEAPRGAFFDLLNMVYERESDNPQAMRGATRLGSTDMGGKVTGLFDYKNGTRLVATSSDGKFYQYTGTDFAVEGGATATGNSTSAHARWSATNFYGATTETDLLVACNGIDAPVKYNGADVTALGGSPPSTGNYPVVWQGRVWMASGSTLFYSVVDDCEDWSAGGGGGSINIYRGFDGDITGLAAFANTLFIFKRASTYRISTTAAFSTINVRNVSTKKGCVSHHTIQEGGPNGDDWLIYISEHGVDAYMPSSVSSGFKPRELGRWIKPILEARNVDRMDVSWAIFNLDRAEYLVEYPTASAVDPQVGLLANMAREGNRRPRWTRLGKQTLTAGAIFVEDNTKYYQYV